MRDDQIRDGATTTNPRHALDPERGDAVDPDRAEPTGADETPADWPPGVHRTDGPGEPPPGQLDRDTTDRDTTGDEFDRDQTDRDTTDRDTTDRDTTDRDTTDVDQTDRDSADRDLTDRDRTDDPAIGVAEAPPGAIPDERPRDSVSPGPLDQPVQSSTDPTAPVVHRDEPPASGAGFRGPVPGSPASGPLDSTSPDGTTSLDSTAPEATTAEPTSTVEASTAEDAVERDETAKPHDHDALDTDRVFSDDQANGFRDRWSEVQASFVDNPTTAVRSADQLVGEVVAALNAALEERQRTLGEGWRDAPDSATEDMRAAFVRYRAVFQRIIGL
jgi:hypothetical protein